jgi:dethiobiotin synthetase
VKALFITATGTETGKTYVTAALCRALTNKRQSVRVLKPVISGFDDETAENSDTYVLLRSLGPGFDQLPSPSAVEACSPWRFTEPLSPDMAARREGREINFSKLMKFCREAQAGPEDVLLIEGIGGAMVPLDDTLTVLDWIKELGIPALVVAGSYLGTLSHTLTTVAAMRERGVKIAGVVVSESEESPVPVAETVETIARFLKGIKIAAVARNAEADVVLQAVSEMAGF